MIKSCLRCGKCKDVCTTHVPEANLLYSPRDKIIGTNLISEAFLYEEQTRRGISLNHFDEFNDVAEHCTICHRCSSPCPVNIDFGDVSIKMRSMLIKQKQKHTNIATKLSMAYLNMTKPWQINLTKKILIDFSYKAQSCCAKIMISSTTFSADSSICVLCECTGMLVCTLPSPACICVATNRRASHTNAFKINEDVVIPLNKLGDYSHGVERINIRLSIGNKLATLGAIKSYFHSIDASTSLIKDKINHTI
jgi:ferredoxin